MKKILFYSKNCKHSINLLNLLDEKNELNDIKLICFEEEKFPSQVTKVPTYITSELNHPLIGKEIFKFFDILEFFDKPTNNIKFWKEKIIRRPKIDNFMKGKEHQMNYDMIRANMEKNNDSNKSKQNMDDLNKLLNERNKNFKY